MPSGAAESDPPQLVGFHVRIGLPVLNAIHAWAEHPLVDLRWCTTWGEQAFTRLAPAFGLPELPFIPGSDFDGDWKIEAPRATLLRRALIWCDDVWCRPQRLGGLDGCPAPASLFIAPDPNKGLLRRHLLEIDAFIGKRTGQPPNRG